MGEVAAALRQHRVLFRRLGQAGKVGERRRVAALGGHPFLHGLQGAACVDGLGDPLRGLCHRPAVAEREHLRREGAAQLPQGAGLAPQHVHGLHDLQCVSDVHAQGQVHVGNQGGHVPPAGRTDGHHGLGQGAAVGLGLHKGAGAALHIQDNGLGARRQLLGENGRGDEGHGVHRGGDVPQGIELLVRRGEIAALADDSHADLLHLTAEGLRGEGGLEAGDGFQLVHGAAGVPQAPAGHLGQLAAQGRHDGRHN